MKPSSQRGPFPAKSLLVRVLLALVGALLVMAGVWLLIPLPPPSISLCFKGYDQSGTNIYAIIGLVNDGRRMIWLTTADGELFAKTPSGWITNTTRNGVTDIPHGLPPSATETLLVEVPSDVLDWQVRVSYSHYSRHHLRYELAAQLLIKLADVSRSPTQLERAFWRSFGALAWCLKFLPEPSEEYGQTHSPIFTNKPPGGAVAPNQT